MLITIGEIKQILREEFEELPTGPGVTLIRAGGLSPVKQAKGATPERHGVWAFIWPYYDLWMLVAVKAFCYLISLK